MVAADDKEDEDDEVGCSEKVNKGDGPPVVGEELCEHCTVAQLHKCTLEKSPMQSTTLRLLALKTPLVLARSQDLTALEKMVKLAN